MFDHFTSRGGIQRLCVTLLVGFESEHAYQFVLINSWETGASIAGTARANGFNLANISALVAGSAEGASECQMTFKEWSFERALEGRVWGWIPPPVVINPSGITNNNPSSGLMILHRFSSHNVRLTRIGL
jgi:hypothetical protein